jgi:cation:H+ antiporter
MIEQGGVALQLNTEWRFLVQAFTSQAAFRIVVGFVLLYVGAESLVKGASTLSTDLGMRAAVAGVTVVAFATTAPELAIGVLSALDFGETLGLGTIVGSNIANIGLVLGVSALIRPLSISDETIRRHLPFMVLAAVLFVGFGFDGVLTRIEGGLFLVALVGFSYVLLTKSDPAESDIVEGMDELTDDEDPATDSDDVVADGDAADGDTATTEEGTETGDDGDDSTLVTDGGMARMRAATDRLPFRVRDLLFVILGLVLLVFGARQLIRGGRTTLYFLGAGDRFVGLTVLALGTSLPELAASVVSAIRGQDDFSVGNVVGSNIYNILAVVGVIVLISPPPVPDDMIGIDFPYLLGVTAFVSALLITRGRIGRIEGLVLLASYGFYIHILL